MFSSGTDCASSEQGQVGLFPSQEEVERKPEQSQQHGPTAPRARPCWPPPLQLCSEGSRTTGYEVWGGVAGWQIQGTSAYELFYFVCCFYYSSR